MYSNLSVGFATIAQRSPARRRGLAVIDPAVDTGSRTGTTAIKRCSKCILPETYPNIRFDSNGVCNYCASAERPERRERRFELENLLDSCRNEGKDFDCVVPVSGGKDSTFVLYQLARKYGMRVLAYNYDSGLVDTQAKINLERSSNELDVPVVSFKQDQKKYLRKMLLAWSRKPSLAMLPMLCLGCRNGIAHGAYEVARKEGIPLIMFGEKSSESGRYKYELFNNHMFTGILLEIFKNVSFLRPGCIHMMIRDYIHMPPFAPPSRIVRALYPHTTTRKLFDYLPADDDEMEAVLEREVGWSHSRQAGSSRRFDCKVFTLKEYLMRRHAHFTDREDELSERIREGAITRREAMQELKGATDPETEQRIVFALLRELDIDRSEIRL